ncbi:hypothetical protein [Actinoplanes sp. NPDC089786]|uniref:hypothetical protein n=1 Tax=Actinoplanes sp. NPDC089786 TaxID=3155185 RepID=UPI00342B7B21
MAVTLNSTPRIPAAWAVFWSVVAARTCCGAAPMRGLETEIGVLPARTGAASASRPSALPATGRLTVTCWAPGRAALPPGVNVGYAGSGVTFAGLRGGDSFIGGVVGGAGMPGVAGAAVASCPTVRLVATRRAVIATAVRRRLRLCILFLPTMVDSMSSRLLRVYRTATDPCRTISSAARSGYGPQWLSRCPSLLRNGLLKPRFLSVIETTLSAFGIMRVDLIARSG